MSIDSVGNFLTIIRNGILVTKSFVFVPYSKMNLAIAEILKNEGYIKDVTVVNDEENEVKRRIKVFLKYVDGESVIREITRISKPGRRRYIKEGSIKPVIGNLGISILTTNKGVMSNRDAQKYSVGGELICTVW